MTRKYNLLSRFIGNTKTAVVAQEFSVDNISCAKGTYADIAIPFTIPSGYETLTTGRFRIQNASSSGVGATSCLPMQIFFSGDTVHLVFRNISESAAKVKVTVAVIFKRTNWGGVLDSPIFNAFSHFFKIEGVAA